jgi:hypothetical protein
MVQIGVLIAAVAAGAFARSWRQAWRIVVATFIVTSAIQTPLVIKGDDIESPVVYWGVQALTLIVGLGIARVLTAGRERRRSVSQLHGLTAHAEGDG